VLPASTEVKAKALIIGHVICRSHLMAERSQRQS
jgi:hypothetical protein